MTTANPVALPCGHATIMDGCPWCYHARNTPSVAAFYAVTAPTAVQRNGNGHVSVEGDTTLFAPGSGNGKPQVRTTVARPKLPPGTQQVQVNDYISAARLAADTITFLPRIPLDVEAVIGVARSGVVPASLIATSLHLPLYFVSQSTGLVDPGHGGRLLGMDHKFTDFRKVLLIDDTAASGREMERCRKIVLAESPTVNILTAAIYVSLRAAELLNLYYAVLPGMHYLEWNWANAFHAMSCGFDFDGILCEDCPRSSDDDGEKYLEFLCTARPLITPRRKPIPLIVTARHVKYEAETREWLRRHRIRVNVLVMRDWDHPTDPVERVHKIALWKADTARRYGVRMFAESEPVQAQLIARRLNRPVLCPALGRVIEPRSTQPQRQKKCIHLGIRTEYRAGCGGWNCLHKCEAGHGEVTPGGHCQTCSDYSPDT